MYSAIVVNHSLTNKGLKMTKTEFFAACAERCIDPSIALESDAVIAALRAKDRDAVIAALDSEF